ncbi:Carboxylesterase family-domain-containing protein [Aspergillus undulatus]|uniref:Carboxylesterase family-domain-containing protein n=1 Tax=Aspergillus undulatus TaxID=1810928 RepID=UPI003CCE3DF7
MRFKLDPSLLIPYLLGQALAAVNPQSSSVSIKIRNDTIFGVSDESTQVQRFLGIPYAQPPVCDLRLRKAVLLKEKFDILKAQSFSPACYGPEVDSNPNSSEDCLTLNIWRTSNQNEPDALKPVLVWFYGKSLQRGFTVCTFCVIKYPALLSRASGSQIRGIKYSSHILRYRKGELVRLSITPVHLECSSTGSAYSTLAELSTRASWVFERQQMADLDYSISACWTSGWRCIGFRKTLLHLEVTWQSWTVSRCSFSLFRMMAYGGRGDNLFRAGVLESDGAPHVPI